MDAPLELDEAGRWMTYGALAKIRGITRPSAERLARRMKWRRQGGNDGFARVLVPVAFIEPAGDRAKDRPHEGQGEPPRDSDASVAFQAALIAVREAHAGEVVALQTRANVAESFAAELRVQLDDAQSELAMARAQVLDAVRTTAAIERAEAGLRHELDGAKAEASEATGLRLELEAAQIGLSEAQADAAELRQAEVARKGRGRWARLRLAWRG